jgi:hypothetical protein
MIIEGRTITTMAELQEFCAAVVASSHVDPARIRLKVPQDMRLDETTRADGRKIYDVQISSAG